MTEPERPINTFYALCSLFLPGLGQLFQKRPGAAIGFFAVFILTAFLPGLIMSLLFIDRFSYQPLRVHVIHIVLFVGVCIPLMLTYFYAVLDAVGIPIEKQDEKPEGEKSKAEPYRFTLVEFLVVIAIIGMLIAFLLPAIPAARPAVFRMQCSNNMKQIALAFQNYHDKHGHFPPAYSVDENGKPLHSWRVLILPYMEREQKALYEKIRLDEPWDSEHNCQFHSQVPREFQCPSFSHRETLLYPHRSSGPHVPSPSGSSYSVIYGAEAAFAGSEPTKREDMTGGTSNVIILVERRTPVNWMNPLSDMTFETASQGINVDTMGISSYHVGGANVALGDGSVRFIPDTIDNATLRALLVVGEEVAK